MLVWSRVFHSVFLWKLIFLFSRKISQERAISLQIFCSAHFPAITDRIFDFPLERISTFEVCTTIWWQSWNPVVEASWRWEPGRPAGTDNFESELHQSCFPSSSASTATSTQCTAGSSRLSQESFGGPTIKHPRRRAPVAAPENDPKKRKCESSKKTLWREGLISGPINRSKKGRLQHWL